MREKSVLPERTTKAIELRASCFGTNSLHFPCTNTIAEGKNVTYLCERPFFSTYNVEVRKNHMIYLQNKDTTLPIA